MTFEEFVDRLDKNNPFYSVFVEDIIHVGDALEWKFARKSSDLFEVTSRWAKEKRYPLVDKKLGMVFGPARGAHEMLRGLLWYYHEGKHSSRLDTEDYSLSGTWYMDAGMGYYISAMRPYVIVAAATYRPDRFDKAMFETFKVEHQELTREERLTIIRGGIIRR